MDKKTIKLMGEELIAIRKELTRHDYRYYVLFAPIISDRAYDHLYKKY